jgi:hypothetical protein
MSSGTDKQARDATARLEARRERETKATPTPPKERGKKRRDKA